jgi:hypothetical protein
VDSRMKSSTWRCRAVKGLAFIVYRTLQLL